MTEIAKNWFDVDRRGLARLLERRGKGWLLHELIANAWDADDVSQVEVLLEPEDGKPLVTIVVRDDAPDGFADLSHSWTLYAESSRKGDARKRGRFNLGEKLVLALCTEASIVSTKGAVLFDMRGRSSMRARRDHGTEFQGLARITRAELAEILTDLKKLIPPLGVATYVNCERLVERTPIATIEATLPTEIADDEGVLRRTARKCTLDVYTVQDGEVAMLYELGIPVVETGDKYHIGVSQKVPLNTDRDNVTPAYLRQIRTLVVNAMHAQLTEDDANTTFVNEALADEAASPAAVSKALDIKYGAKRAIWDPSDPEANMNLTSQGYTLIKGAQLTKHQWANVKKHDGARTRPAGQIAPTKRVEFSPDGEDRWVPRDKWTPAMHRVVEYTLAIGQELLGHTISVNILADATADYGACYGDRQLVFNLGTLGRRFFEDCSQGPTERVNALVVHELGHAISPNHLSKQFHAALCELGAKLTMLALTKPTLFQW